MTEIARSYQNIAVVSIAPTPLEDDLEIHTEETPEGEATPSSIDSSSRAREEYSNTHIGKLTFPRQIVEEKAHKKCIEILTSKLSDSLYPTVGSYTYLSDIYKIDRLARQMFYEVAQKSGADSLYLSARLDHRYQIEDNFVITIEQESRRFFLETPFGRRRIKNPEDQSKLLDRCCKSRAETLHAALLIIIQVGKRIFTPRRMVKTDPFIRFENYMQKKWHRVRMDPLNEVDEGLGIHYSPTRELAGYMDPVFFTSFQIYDIEKRLRSRRKL